MFMFRTYQAARYHTDNVSRLLEKDRAQAEKLLDSVGHPATDLPDEIPPEMARKLSAATVRASIVQDALPYAFELSAFLQALRSSLDFLATVCIRHLSDKSRDSVATLLGLATKGASGPIVDQVAQHLEWLTQLRDYRDRLVHRLLLQPRVGAEAASSGGRRRVVHYPVVVPKATPQFIPDTREARMLRDEHGGAPEGLTVLEREGWVESSDGRSECHEFSGMALPNTDYIGIDAFMAQNLASFEAFVGDVLRQLADLNFGMVRPTRDRTHRG
jgi:hypothetical protein